MLNIDDLIKKVETMGEAALSNLHADVLQAESDARRQLYVLRQRFSMLGSDIHNAEEKTLTDAMDVAKKSIADAEAVLAAIKNRLHI